MKQPMVQRVIALLSIVSLVMLPLQQTVAASITKEYYHYNHQGSPIGVYDGKGNEILIQRWSSWGERQVLKTSAPGTSTGELLKHGLPAHMGYTGHKDLVAAGLVFMGDTRLYSPPHKRFLNPDDRTTGGIRGENRFTYAFNNPLSFIDPDGHSPRSIVAMAKAVSSNLGSTISSALATRRLSSMKATLASGISSLPQNKAAISTFTARIIPSSLRLNKFLNIPIIIPQNNVTDSSIGNDGAYNSDVVEGSIVDFYSEYGAEPQPGTLSNIEARQWYLEQEAEILNRLDRSAPLKYQAQQAFNLRNQYRTKARELMIDRLLADQLTREESNLTWEEINSRAVRKLGLNGIANPTNDQVYQEIINSSQRSRKSVNDQLGI